MQGNVKPLKDDNGYLYPVTLANAVFVSKDKSLDKKIFEMEDGLKHNSGLQWLTDVDLITNPLLDNAVLGYNLDGKWRAMEMRGTYYVELKRWGISNVITDYTDSIQSMANSGGITKALKWANDMGYTEVVLPPGDYLINEYAPIIPQSYTTLNLGGARLRIRDNDQEGYAVIQFGNNQTFSRVTNGIIEGDKDTHNYVIDGVGADTHEGGRGIFMNGHSSFVSIDNLEIFNFTGDAITLLPTPNWQFTMGNTYWEAGNLSTTDGSLATSTTKIRTKNFLSISSSNFTTYGFLGIYGNSWGDLGSQITTETADIYFYDTNSVFLKVVHVRVFDDINIPKGSSYIKVVLYQSAVPDTTVSDSVVLSIGVAAMNRWTYIEKNKLHDNRRCGIAGGGKHVFLRENDIYQIRGVAPGTVIDIEDGYGLNQYWDISGNRMYDSKVGLSFVSTKHVTCTNNEFRNISPGTVWDECVNFVFEGNRWNNASLDVRGEATFVGEQLWNSNFIFNNASRQIVDSCYFKDSNISITKDLPFTFQMNNCHFLLSKEPSVTNGFFYFTSQPQTVTNCIFEGSQSSGSSFGGQGCNDWVFTGCVFLNNDNGNSVLLPGGRYSECVFNNVSSINIPNFNTLDFEFFNCTFVNNVHPIVTNTTNGYYINSVKFDNCKITGTDTPLVSGNGTVHGTIEFRNNNVKFLTASTITSLFSISGISVQYVLNKLIIDNNRITSNKSFNIVGYDENVDITNKIMSNNYLDGVTQTYDLPGWNRYNNYSTATGLVDSHLTSTAIPTTGYYRQGEIVKDSNMSVNGYLGWACSKSGLADAYAAWKPSFFYNNNLRITDNGYVYLSTVWNGKTVATKPAFSTTLYAKTNDLAGLIPWTANTAYAVGALVLRTDGTTVAYQECTIAGTSGATEPIWSATTTVVDGTATWIKRSTEIWKCIGTVAEFKRIGALG